MSGQTQQPANKKRRIEDDVEDLNAKVDQVVISEKAPTSSSGSSRKGKGAKDRSFQKNRNSGNSKANEAVDKAFDAIKDALQAFSFDRAITVKPREFYLETSQIYLFIEQLVQFMFRRYKQIQRHVNHTPEQVTKCLAVIVNDITLVKIKKARSHKPISRYFEKVYDSIHHVVKTALEPAVSLPTPVATLINLLGEFEYSDRKQIWMPEPRHCSLEDGFLKLPLVQCFTLYPKDGEWFDIAVPQARLPEARLVLPVYERFGEAILLEAAGPSAADAQHPDSILRVKYMERSEAYTYWEDFVANVERRFASGFSTWQYHDIDGSGTPAQMVGRNNNVDAFFSTNAKLTPVTMQLGGFSFRPTVEPLPSFAIWTERVIEVEAYTDHQIIRELCNTMDNKSSSSSSRK